ncbi:MAG: S-adenosylmethionine:tRNA ribosyltransferase-isomerase [Chitinophagaceae bacterium]
MQNNQEAFHPKNLSIVDFDYLLPDDRIAKYPLEKRDESKLLIYKNEEITQSIYANIDAYIPENSLLVFNNTKVVEARLLFQKITGGNIEIFCLEPHEQYADITTAMLTKQKVWWNCLIGGAKKWKDEVLSKQINEELNISAKKIGLDNEVFIIEFEWNDASLSFAEILHIAGLIPLPPYLNRTAEEKDKTTYQTIYAAYDGSVAAPTAGLHFTNAIFEKLAKKQIAQCFVTLHVGAGTFKPVKAATMHEHEMHAEYIDVSIHEIEQLKQQQNAPIIAVGTTSLRTIESLYWMGVKLLHLNKPFTQITTMDIMVHQWDAYELPKQYGVEDALGYLLKWMDANKLTRIVTKTQIIIAPGYQLKVAEGIITNFHQPKSTLLLLIAAVIGNDWHKVYDYALINQFRFLSYGDGSLLWKK